MRKKKTRKHRTHWKNQKERQNGEIDSYGVNIWSEIIRHDQTRSQNEEEKEETKKPPVVSADAPANTHTRFLIETMDDRIHTQQRKKNKMREQTKTE